MDVSMARGDSMECLENSIQTRNTDEKYRHAGLKICDGSISMGACYLSKESVQIPSCSDQRE